MLPDGLENWGLFIYESYESIWENKKAPDKPERLKYYLIFNS